MIANFYLVHLEMKNYIGSNISLETFRDDSHSAPKKSAYTHTLSFAAGWLISLKVLDEIFGVQPNGLNCHHLL